MGWKKFIGWTAGLLPWKGIVEAIQQMECDIEKLGVMARIRCKWGENKNTHVFEEL